MASKKPTFLKKINSLATLGYNRHVVQAITNYCVNEAYDEETIFDDLQSIFDSSLMQHLQQKYKMNKKETNDLFLQLRQIMHIGRKQKPKKAEIGDTVTDTLSKARDIFVITGYCRTQHLVFTKHIIEILVSFYHLNLSFVVSKLNFKKLKASDIDKTKLLYQAQCKGLVHNAKQASLWQCLAYCRKNRLPLLTLCNDRFCRDRLTFYYQNKKTLSLTDWFNKYKVLDMITPPGLQSNGIKNIIRSAMTTFFHRYISLLQLPVTHKYNDSLEAFTDFIIQTTDFIRTLMINDGIYAPFQIELMIIPRKMAGLSEESESEEEDDDFDDDDSVDSDDSDDNDDGNTNSNVTSSLPKIEERLIGNRIKYVYTKLNGDECRSRTFHTMFQNLRQKIKSDANGFGIPHRKRLCIVVDRRDADTQIFMYLPNVLGNIPANHVSEWYFESSNQCIVPGNTEKEIIKSKSNVDGAMFLLSFHCEELDQLRCYLYTRSQMVRFLPQDVYKLFPHLFVVESGSLNAKFVEREKNKRKREKTQRIKLRDVMFDYFLQQTLKERQKRRKAFHLKDQSY